MKQLFIILIAASTAACIFPYNSALLTTYAYPGLSRQGAAASIEIPQEGIYDLMLSSVTGPLTYYNQGDARWQDFLYGNRDSFPQYGCGPTVMAMVVTSLTGNLVTPPQMAEWAVENGCWASGQGSHHKLIPEAARAYGLEVESLKSSSVEQMEAALKEGNLLVTLMSPGVFTERGHFLIITEITPEGMFHIADSGTYENTKLDWDPQVVHDNLNRGALSGGPVWAIRVAQEPDNAGA